MNHLKVLSFIAIIMIFSMGCKNKPGKKERAKVQYPETKKIDSIDEYFGNKVLDPYRWLEDDMSDETMTWVKKQNEVTFNYLSQIPYRDDINDRLKELWDFPKYGTPFKKGDYYFFFKNDGMQNQSVLYIQDDLDSEPEVFLDPNKLSDDGTVALSSMAVSENGEYFAYSIARSGSDWKEIFVKEIVSGKKLDEHLKWVKFSGIAWKDDGFYYSRYDEPTGSKLSQKNKFHKVYYHKIGQSQADDQLIYENHSQPLRNYYASTTEDERYLFLTETESTSGNSIYYKDLEKGQKDFKLLAKGFDYDYNVIGNVDDKIYMLTNYKADNYKLVMVQPPNVNPGDWTVVLPEEEEVLKSAKLIGGKIIAIYMKDASSRAYAFNYEGEKEYEIELPTLGTIGSFSGEKDENTAFYSFTSFTFPTTIYKFDAANNQSEVYKKPEIDFDINKYQTKQVFYKSKDGTKIPMFIVHKKGLELDGSNPTLLYGYGGFNISLTPSFSITNLILLENNGIYALANIRGGGEYGEEWHQDGIKLNKQNVFDDFISAAEYLIEKKYTSKDKLAIRGGSNGGLLVGACMTQRPDLFKVAIPAVGVLDMLRYHKFTIGWAWATDYGTSEDSIQFKNLYSYSPLHNIKEGTEYPATLVTTADHDDRVVPAHSFKFIATLQEKHKGENPVLIRIETKAGHSAGKPTSKIIDEYTDIWSFMFYNMGVEPEY